MVLFAIYIFYTIYGIGSVHHLHPFTVWWTMYTYDPDRPALLGDFPLKIHAMLPRGIRETMNFLQDGRD